MAHTSDEELIRSTHNTPRFFVEHRQIAWAALVMTVVLEALGPRLPAGATPVQFQSDFGDTAALMMTVASPPVDDLEVELRARSAEEAIRSARAAAGRSKLQPVSIICTFPLSLSENAVTQASEGFPRAAESDGVIVSHVIVLFDFIEDRREKGARFEQAIRDAGIERLRPVLITVGATILALFPLASHGGPRWQPLCYAQIGGLTVATFITLLLVPVLYSIAVLDLRIVKWEAA